MSRSVNVFLDTRSQLPEVARTIADALGGSVTEKADGDETYFDVRGGFGFFDVTTNFYIDDCGIPFESYDVIVCVHGAASVGNNAAHHQARLALARQVAQVFEADTRCLVVDNSQLVVFRNAP